MDLSIPQPPETRFLEEILERVKPELKRILSRYRIPPHEAADLLEEILLVLVSKAESIRHPEAWLRTALAGRCAAYWRRKRNGLWAQIDTAVRHLLDDPAVPLREREELRDRIAAVVAEMPDPCRSLLRLHYGLDGGPELGGLLEPPASGIGKDTRDCIAALSQHLLLAGACSTSE